MHDETVTKADIHASEKLWSAQLAGQNLSDEDFQKWLAFKSISKLHLRLHDSVVGWSWEGGVAVKDSSFRLHRIGVTSQGVDYLFLDEWENPTRVGYSPILLGDTDTFVWVNHFNEFRHTPRDKTMPACLASCPCV